MKKINTKLTMFAGGVCALLVVLSSWYTITFNDSRFIAPMNLSEYTFRTKDLPMIVSGLLLVLYILYLCVLLVRGIIINKRKGVTGQSTRTINPKWGFLGFFGFFGFFYEGKMSDTFMDERYKENKIKAHMTANKIALAIIFVSILFLGQGKLIGNLEYTLIALIIVVTLSIALEMFLSEYLLYRYDHDEQFDESEE